MPTHKQFLRIVLHSHYLFLLLLFTGISLSHLRTTACGWFLISTRPPGKKKKDLCIVFFTLHGTHSSFTRILVTVESFAALPMAPKLAMKSEAYALSSCEITHAKKRKYDFFNFFFIACVSILEAVEYISILCQMTVRGGLWLFKNISC